MNEKYPIQKTAIEICRELETVLSRVDCHVALTGGCLYKDGARKDIDIIIYPHANKDIDWDAVADYLEIEGFELGKDLNKVFKATRNGYSFDFFRAEMPKMELEFY